jgi:predicted DNA-binding protein
MSPPGGDQMSGTSRITRVMMVRLPVDIAQKVEDSAAKQGRTVSDYLRRLIMLQVTRKR